MSNIFYDDKVGKILEMYPGHFYANANDFCRIACAACQGVPSTPGCPNCGKPEDLSKFVSGGKEGKDIITFCGLVSREIGEKVKSYFSNIVILEESDPAIYGPDQVSVWIPMAEASSKEYEIPTDLDLPWQVRDEKPILIGLLHGLLWVPRLMKIGLRDGRISP